jgi:molybdopterin converting factor subunit 1
MRVTIRLFARLRDLAGSGTLTRDVADGASVDTVWQALAQEFPAIAPLRPSIAVAVNAEYAKFEAPVAEGDQVAFLPPVSGG